MKANRRIILLTLGVSIVIWGVCIALAILVSPGWDSANTIGRIPVAVIVITLFLTIIVSLAIGINMSRMSARHRKTLNALQESEDRFRALSEAAFEGIFIHDGNILLEANSAGAKLLGYEPAEIRGKPATEFIAPESIDRVMKNIRAGYAEPYEATIRRRDGTTFPAELLGRDAIYQGQKVRVVSMRNFTQRKQAETELSIRAELLDASSDSIFLRDFQGNFLYVNEAAYKTRGYTRDELMKLNVRNLDVPEYAKFIPDREAKLKKSGSVIFETAHFRKDKSTMPVEVHARVFKRGDKECILSIARDITERKQAEEEVEKLARFPSENPNPVLRINRDGIILYANAASAPLLEMWKATTGAAVPENWRKTIADVLATGTLYQTEVEHRSRIFALSFVPIKGTDYLNLYVRDITDRKKAEEALLQEKNFARNIIDTAQTIILTLDKEGKILQFNPYMEEISGYHIEEVQGKDWFDTFLPAQHRERIKSLFKQAINNIQTRGNIDPIIARDGSERCISWYDKTLRDTNGNVIGLLAIGHDITEQKQAEEALRTSEENFRNSLDSSPMGIMITTYLTDVTDILYVNQSLLDIYGYKNIEELQNTPVKDRYTPESYAAWAIRKEKRRLGEKIDDNLEISIIRKDGSIRHLKTIYKEVAWDGQKRLQVLYCDITEQKQAEERLTRISLNSPVGTYIAQDDKFQTVNPQLAKDFGYSEAELLSLDPMQIVHSEDRDMVRRNNIKMLKGENLRPFEFRGITKNNDTIWLLASVVSIQYRGRRALLGIPVNITERKRMEEALRMTKLNFRNSLDSSPLGIRIVTANGETIYINQALLDMYGYENLGEFRGKSTEVRYTSESYEEFLERKEKRNRGEYVPSNYEISIVRKDGKVKNLEVFRKAVLWGSELQFQTIYLDATERKQAEEAMKVSELRYRRLFEAAKDGILILDANTGLIMDVNPFLIELLGLAHQEIIGKELWQLGFLRDIIANKANFLELQRNQYIRYEDLPMQTTNGKIMNVEFVSNVYEVDHKRIIQCNIRDITARKQAEQALRISEVNFRNSIDISPLGTMISTYGTDPVEILYVNQALLDFYGYKNIEEMRSVPIQERYTPESYAEYCVRKERRRKGETIAPEVEISVIRKDGAIIHLKTIYKEVIWDGQKRLQMLYQDITEQKRAEQDLLESERKYRELVETAQEGIWVINDKSNVTFTNQRMAEILGYTAEEMSGKPLFDIVDIKGVQTRMQQLERRRLGIRDEYDTEYLHKDGRRIYVRVGATPLYDDRGNFRGTMAVVTDISELKQAEEHILHLNAVLNALRGINQLVVSEKDTRSFVQKSCDILVNARGYDVSWVMLADKNGKFTSADSSGIESRIFMAIVAGIKKGEYPQCIADLLKERESIIICPQLGSRHKDCPLDELGGNLGNLTGKLVHAGRFYGVLSVQLLSKLAVNKEEQNLFKELLTDIAFALDRLEKAKLLEAAEEQARETERLREIDRLRSELLANVSHELRTPLASIKGYTTTMLRKDVKWSAKDTQEFLQTIDHETDRLTRLISDILDMSRIEAGALKLKLEQCQVTEIIDSIKARLAVLAVRHKLKIEVPRELAPVVADEMRIGQVISNLVENAVKFSPSGSTITIAVQRDNKNIVISIADRGEGMTRDVMGKLFNRFYQAEDVVTGRRSGTGLGLAICRGIIEKHGGKIWVESVVKEGSKFSFSLPIPQEEQSD